MTDDRLTPDEFARLLSLPESHRDRVAAERQPEFAAMRAMLADFETGTLPHDERATVTAELTRRVAERRNDAGAPGSRPARARTATPGGFLARLFGPTGRAGLAFAAVALVAGLGWWSLQRAKAPELIRGDSESSFVAAEPVATPDGLELTWPAAQGAEAYRVVFLGEDLAELGRMDAGAATRMTLRNDSLPAGLDAGHVRSFEVQALAQGAVLATTPARALQLR